MPSRATSFIMDGAGLDDSGCSAVADCPGHLPPAPLRAQRAPGRTLRRTATERHTRMSGHRLAFEARLTAQRPALAWIEHSPQRSAAFRASRHSLAQVAARAN